MPLNDLIGHRMTQPELVILDTSADSMGDFRDVPRTQQSPVLEMVGVGLVSLFGLSWKISSKHCLPVHRLLSLEPPSAPPTHTHTHKSGLLLAAGSKH